MYQSPSFSVRWIASSVCGTNVTSQIKSRGILTARLEYHFSVGQNGSTSSAHKIFRFNPKHLKLRNRVFQTIYFSTVPKKLSCHMHFNEMKDMPLTVKFISWTLFWTTLHQFVSRAEVPFKLLFPFFMSYTYFISFLHVILIYYHFMLSIYVVPLLRKYFLPHIYKHLPFCNFSLYLKKAGLVSRNIVH